MMVVLAQSRERYFHCPTLVAVGAGPSARVELVTLVWEKDTERVARFEVRGLANEGPIDLTEAPSSTTAHEAPLLGLDRSGRPIVEMDEATEDAASDGPWHVAIERSAGCSRVIVSGPRAARMVVWEAFGTAAAPDIAATTNGAWVAFHHNVREDNGEPDLAKWIAIRFVDDAGNVLAPEANMAERDRDREGEEQGFEFPSLVVGTDGALAVFGRGSHRFWRQDLNSWGWSERTPLDDGNWGCRGRRVSVLRLGDGRIVTAQRGREGIVVQSAMEPTGGRAQLEPAETRVQPKFLRACSASEPSLASSPQTRDGRRVLFGDIHQHSAHSDGVGTADEPYERARHIYGDDFCALTDHESFLAKRIGPSEWAYLCAVANRHNEPGRFATLLGYEWTGRSFPGPGHKVVYLPAGGGPIRSRDAFADGRGLLDAVRQLGGFAVPHHVGWTGADAESHAPDVQPVWEICSCHGCYESWAHVLGQRGDLRDQMIDAVLRRGQRFGFIASSDGHGLLYHHGIARKRDPFRTGLTAVHATDCSREAILAAIRERRCYATSGAKIWLDVVAGSAPMGSELAEPGKVPVEVLARAQDPLARVELVGSRGVLAVLNARGEREARLTARVSEAYVYARVVQEDGEIAWSSPIFWPTG